MRKEQVPKYDERFRGYGMNKIIHLLSVDAEGFEFHVLPEAFVVAGYHERSKDWKRTFKSKGSKSDRLLEMQALFNIARTEITGVNPLLRGRKPKKGASKKPSGGGGLDKLVNLVDQQLMLPYT